MTAGLPRLARSAREDSAPVPVEGSAYVPYDRGIECFGPGKL
jgi:hypothetical protein